MGSDPVLDHAPREGVRTFTPRWRNSPLTDERMATLLPARSLPEGPLVPAGGVRAGGAGRARDRLGARGGRHRLLPGPPRGRPRRRRGARARGGPHARRGRRGRRAPTSGCTPATRCRSSPSGWPRRRWRRCTCSSPTPGRRTSTPSGGSCSSTPSTCWRRAWWRAACCGSPPTSPPTPPTPARSCDHHGRWDVVEGERPPWRPDDGFEAKGVRAGRTVTELTCTLRRA